MSIVNNWEETKAAMAAEAAKITAEWKTKAAAKNMSVADFSRVEQANRKRRHNDRYRDFARQRTEDDIYAVGQLISERKRR